MRLHSPAVLVDCDGVLSNFVEQALAIAAKELGREFSPEDVTGWDVFRSIGRPDVWDVYMKRASRPGFCLSMEPYPEALKGMKNLRRRFDVRVVTAPLDAPPWMHERALWIEKHFGIPKTDVIFTHHKELVRGISLIDDKPEHVIAWAEANPDRMSFLWEQPYNRRIKLPENVIRTSDWSEVIDVLRTIE